MDLLFMFLGGLFAGGFMMNLYWEMTLKEKALGVGGYWIEIDGHYIEVKYCGKKKDK